MAKNIIEFDQVMLGAKLPILHKIICNYDTSKWHYTTSGAPSSEQAAKIDSYIAAEFGPLIQRPEEDEFQGS